MAAETIKGPGWSVDWTVTDGVETYALPVKTWSINRSRREPLDWSVTMPYSRLMRPRGEAGRLLQPEPYDSNWNLRRWLQCVIRVGAATWTSPRLVLNSYRVGLKKGERLLTISGSDRTEALLEEDVIEEDVRSRPEATIAASSAIAQTLVGQGVSDYDIDIDDFLVKMFHRSGVPLAYLRELFEVFQGVFWWEGDTFTIRNGGRNVGEEVASYALHEAQNITVLDYQKDTGEACNEITIEHVSELTAQYASGRDLGNVSVSINNPSGYCALVIRLLDQGYHEDVVWDDESGNPINTLSVEVIRTSVKAHTLRFNLYPPEGSGSLDPIRWQAWIMTDASQIPEFGSIDDGPPFVVVRSEFDQDRRGRKKLPSPLTFAHAPTLAVCYQAGVKKLAEELRKYKSVLIQAALNPLVRPDLVGAVTASDLDLYAHNMMTETVGFSGNDKGCSMTVGLSRELTEEDLEGEDE